MILWISSTSNSKVLRSKTIWKTSARLWVDKTHLRGPQPDSAKGNFLGSETNSIWWMQQKDLDPLSLSKWYSIAPNDLLGVINSMLIFYLSWYHDWLKERFLKWWIATLSGVVSYLWWVISFYLFFLASLWRRLKGEHPLYDDRLRFSPRHITKEMDFGLLYFLQGILKVIIALYYVYCKQ